MSLLQIVKTKPEADTDSLMRALAQNEQTTRFNLYEDQDYDKLVELIFSHDQVVSWW